jgi:hypothetical protein
MYIVCVTYQKNINNKEDMGVHCLSHWPEKTWAIRNTWMYIVCVTDKKNIKYKENMVVHCLCHWPEEHEL